LFSQIDGQIFSTGNPKQNFSLPLKETLDSPQAMAGTLNSKDIEVPHMANIYKNNKKCTAFRASEM